ncbi:MAG: hypothetical protein COB02_11775 [Candidatus Cloacimonadota bacterium]|nr:MAG: hypothetical protein COB02_11775 [Candidatus Cloacimonadota bacterium]
MDVDFINSHFLVALEMGISIFDFWKITLSEFYAYCHAYNKRKINEHNSLITQSYYMAVFTRVKTLESLEKYLFSEDNKKELSKEELEQEKENLSKMFGV